ncbi:MAG: DUF2520 domain-containing protein [Bacteroidetes bacterium]|nr:DUF2520 domain-containing protein [Bacteroidota bacterium]
MSKHPIRKIVILGAGRLATNLSVAIRKKGYEIAEVYNRTERHGTTLARKLKARYVSEPELLTKEADLYILAVSDGAIPEVLSHLKCGNQLLVHTSGSAGMDVLKTSSSRHGVIYPPQTFTMKRLVNFRSVPLCIEGNSAETAEQLTSFAATLSDQVFSINSDQRKILHLAAVFANNFTNFMYVIAQELLTEKGMDFRMLEPIIRLTAARTASGNVAEKQTGPAIRGDMDTMREHLALLSGHPDYKEIYELISQRIIEKGNKT